MESIVVIPARGGSKRLVGKNIRLLNGLPLIAHSIIYAQRCGVEQIIVSTDDSTISEVAKNFGAKIHERSHHLATDESPTIETLQEVVQDYQLNDELIILLQPTNPLRPQYLIQKALKTMDEYSYDSLMTVSKNHQKFGRIVDNHFVPYNYKLGQRSQDLEPLYFENGLLYIAKVNIIKKGKLLGGKHYPMILEHPFANVDIDTHEDLEYAEYILTKVKK